MMMVMTQVIQASILLSFVGAMTAETSNGVWISVENRIDSFSPPANHSLVVTGGKHIIGLSNPAFSNNQFSSIFATELGVRGPSVYQISQDAQILLASPQADSSKMPSYFEDIAYDQQNNELFLTSKNTKSVFKMPAIKGGKPTSFLTTGDKKPTGISIDTCSRNIFWTNSNRKHPSIEVFHPDTGNSWTLINSNLTRPKAITVDTPARKVYWTDTKRGAFWISRSNLDGTDREVVCEGKDHEAFSIVVSEEFIYWSDWTSHALWRTSKSGDCNFQLIQKFKTSKPHGVSFIPESKYKCDEYTNIVQKPSLQTISTTTTKEQEAVTTSTTENDERCTNYCFNGVCSIVSGNPVCDCDEDHIGSRCQIDKCFNFCMESGQCLILEDEPECLCPDGFQGDRCQVSVLPKVEELSGLVENTHSSKSSAEDPNILVFILGGTTGALTVVVIGLSVFINRLRLRPRVVRKRFISIAGSNNRKGDDILKPSSSCGLPVDDGITLDIENCCNMTLCDTPCFEPPTRGPKKNKKSKSCKGAQDKKSLLADDDADY